MTKELIDIAKKANIVTPIETAKVAFTMLNYIMDKRIEISKYDHQYLKEILELSPMLLEKYLNILSDGYNKSVKNSNNNSIDYFNKITQIYEPSEELKNAAFERHHKSSIQNEEGRKKDLGWIGKIVASGIVMIIGIATHNKTKPKSFWQK